MVLQHLFPLQHRLQLLPNPLLQLRLHHLFRLLQLLPLSQPLRPRKGPFLLVNPSPWWFQVIHPHLRVLASQGLISQAAMLQALESRVAGYKLMDNDRNFLRAPEEK